MAVAIDSNILIDVLGRPSEHTPYSVEALNAALTRGALIICPVVAAETSMVVGRTVAWVEDQARGAFFIVQINRRDADAITQPEPEMEIGAGDGIVIVGRGARAHALSGLFAAREERG